MLADCITVCRFPNTSLWVTEYNLDGQNLATTQDFYNTSAEYLDRLDYIERYSFFGAFRSDVSNVGPNAAMLSAGGQLTDIGVWYLGLTGDGVAPTEGSSGANGFKDYMPAAFLMGFGVFGYALLMLS